MSAQVVVRNLHKCYDGTEALCGVNFAAAPGEILGLLGPNGAGKTTALECLTGLREPDSGEILVGSIDVRRQPNEARQRIGVVLQGTALPGQITPREALAMFGAFYREPVPPQVLLERFALTDKAGAKYDTLSSGQRQRLALALAFVNRPTLVVLDEPSAGLDPQTRRELQAEIVRMKAEGHTVILSTHDLDEAGRLCDQLVILDHGRVLATGTPEELIARPDVRQAVTLITYQPLDPVKVSLVPGVHELQADGATLRFLTTDGPRTIAALMQLVETAQAGLVDLQVRQDSLEEIFLHLTRNGDHA